MSIFFKDLNLFAKKINPCYDKAGDNMEKYIQKVNEIDLSKTTKEIMIQQIKTFYEIKENGYQPNNPYHVGDNVKLEKGTLLHGTYKNLEGLKEIMENGLISSWFIDGRLSKYPSSVGVWNLKQNYLLKEYINFYSGGTILYGGIFENGIQTSTKKTAIIPYDEMPNIMSITTSIDCHMWTLEQTKEARFMPSLVQNRVQIGVIFNGNNPYTKELLKGDILNPQMISDTDVREFVNPNYYEKFIKDRGNKDDFFTDRESAILFGLPSNLIEGVLVGRDYEKNPEILKEIKNLIHGGYICNLDGKVIL